MIKTSYYPRFFLDPYSKKYLLFSTKKITVVKDPRVLCDAFNRDYATIRIVGRNFNGHKMDGSSCCVNAISARQTEIFAIREIYSIINQRRLLHTIIKSD